MICFCPPGTSKLVSIKSFGGSGSRENSYRFITGRQQGELRKHRYPISAGNIAVLEPDDHRGPPATLFGTSAGTDSERRNDGEVAGTPSGHLATSHAQRFARKTVAFTRDLRSHPAPPSHGHFGSD